MGEYQNGRIDMKDMWTYQGIYRCKLCGKIFYGDKLNTGASFEPDSTVVDNFAWHYYDCEDRCWGAGEAIGIKIVKYTDEYWDD